LLVPARELLADSDWAQASSAGGLERGAPRQLSGDATVLAMAITMARG